MGGDTGEELLFVPEGLSITKLAGGGEGIELIASTLLETSTGPELYAAVSNDGEAFACDAAIAIEFFDDSEQSIAAWIGGLYGGRLYRRSDGSGSIISCIGPGETAMAGSTDLPGEIVINELGYAVYRFSYFNRGALPFELVPVDDINVSQVQSVRRASGSAFTGALENGLDVTMSNPSVAIFPLNRVGRPLGMATSSEMLDIAPGSAWSFETTTVEDAGVEHAIYPGASILF